MYKLYFKLRDLITPLEALRRPGEKKRVFIYDGLLFLFKNVYFDMI